MNRKFLIGLCALFIVIILGVIAFRFWGNPVDTPSIAIPSPSTEGADTPGDGDVSRLEVDAGSVKELLRSIDRKEVYCRGYQLWTYWEGGEAEARISVWQDGELFRVLHNQNGVGKNTMVDGNKVYYWYENSKTVYSAPLEGAGQELLDSYARLLTTDELMELPEENILEAAFLEKCGENCVYVLYETPEGRSCGLYVSVDNGLLTAAEVKEDGRTIYLLESVFIEDRAPDPEIFDLPN